MEVDTDYGHHVPRFISYFDLTPQLFPWRDPRPHEIEYRRAQLSDLLIFDILLSSGGIQQPDAFYPPSDVASLQRLLEAIDKSTYDVLKKDCLVYFLLKWHQDGRESRFMSERCIPPQFGALADAYWFLDTGSNVPAAVSLLSDSRLNRDFASKIIQAISLSTDSTRLILKYIRTAKPLLTEPDDIDIYSIALAESSFLDAWQFQRTFSEKGEVRERLLRKIVGWCLSPTPRRGPLAQLLAFPFTSYEQSLIHSYALNPPASCPAASVPVIQDLVCVRLIQSGQYASAIKMDRQFSLATFKVTQSVQKAIQDRRAMIDEVLNALPAVERALLESELEVLSQGPSSKVPTVNGVKHPVAPSNGDAADLSMSWEEIRAPYPSQPQINGHIKPADSPAASAQPAVALRSLPAFPLSERSGAPRFAGNILSSSRPVNLTNDSPSTIRNPFSSATASLPPTVPRIAGSTPYSVAPQQPPALFQNANRGLKLSSGPTSRFAPSTSTGAGSAAPLFSSQGSNANSMRNAFYNPPPQINGVNRALGEDVPHITSEIPAHIDDTADVNMDSEDEIVHQVRRRGNGSTAMSREDEADANLGYSVFARPRGADVSTAPEKKAIADSSAATSSKMPPGAFTEEESDEDEKERVRTTRPRRHHASPPAAEARAPRASRAAPKQARVRPQDLGRSLPGSLMNDEEEDNSTAPEDAPDDDEDCVAPLPSPKRPVRKARVSRAGSAETDGADTEDVPRRRSSRLSTTPSAQLDAPAKKISTRSRKSAVEKTSEKPKSSTATRRKR